jgi:hypothetical protein
MITRLLIGWLALAAVSLAGLGIAAARSPEGMEDQHGFRVRYPKQQQQETKV